VGLRIFALHNLGDDHRKLLVLDEQDCWLRPDRVPKLIALVRQASRELGFQMIVISHHDLHLVENHADRIFQIIP
jgi:ABC-type glutathione transport system ATPase component